MPHNSLENTEIIEMNNAPRISEAEWQIMKVLWKNSPLTANEIVDFFAEINNWSHKTIRTIINRLVKKGTISYSKIGREYQYYPVDSESQCVKSETWSFIQRIYGGTLSPVILNIIDNFDIFTPQEIEELKKIISEDGNGSSG